MANLTKFEQNLTPLRKLIEASYMERSRLEVERADFFVDGVTLTIRNKHTGRCCLANASAEEVNEIVKDFKPTLINGLNMQPSEYPYYTYLRGWATDFKRDWLLKEILDVLFFKAVDEITEFSQMIA